MAAYGPQTIRTGKPRELRYLLKKLGLYNPLEQTTDADIQALNKSINDKIKLNANFNDKAIDDTIKILANELNENILPASSFQWMSDENACFYAWGRIRKFSNIETLEKPTLPIFGLIGALHKNNNKTEQIIFYEDLHFKEHPFSTEERLYNIIEFFDSEQIQLSKQNKVALIEKIEKEWNEIYDNKKPFNWLNNKDEEQCEWAWHYIKEHSDFCSYLSPKTNHERYLSIFTSFYLWDTSEAIKKLFLISIGKANSQKKFRKSIKEKKALNIFIDKKIKEKLDKISIKKGLRINKTIEHLIEKEYEDLFKSGVK